MFALIRARFPKTPTTGVWSDTVAANWLDPSIPFSLAHYFKMATFEQVDFAGVVLPPLVVDDPRTGAPDDRERLVEAVLAAADSAFHPDWKQFDRCIIVFAQGADSFAISGLPAPNGKVIPTAVFDLGHGFDVACQEVAHTLGLQHELGAWSYGPSNVYSNEYGCPYSVMSAPGDYTFDRGLDPRLPGMPPFDGQRRIGPYLPAAHLYINQYRPVNPTGMFNHPDSVSYVPASYEYNPASVRLYARDAAVAAWPVRRTVLAVVPPIVPGGDTHFLELRRKGAAYDSGIDKAAIVILTANFFAGNGTVSDPSSLRLHYAGRIDLEGTAGDLDYHSFSGRFVVRVRSAAAGFESVELTIAGGNAWQDFRLTLDDLLANRMHTWSSNWTPTLVAPCPLSGLDEFSYRVNRFVTFFVLQVQSIGYETPHYLWRVGGITLDPQGDGTLDLPVPCRDVNGHEMTTPAPRTVSGRFRISGGRLELAIVSPFADIVLDVEAVVGESSPSVMKNYYPERSLFTNIRADNLEVEWDGKYQAASEACWKRFQDINDRFQEVVLPGRPTGDPWEPFADRIGVREIIRVLAERDPRSAYAVAAVVADRAALRAEDVLRAVRSKTGGGG